MFRFQEENGSEVVEEGFLEDVLCQDHACPEELRNLIQDEDVEFHFDFTREEPMHAWGTWLYAGTGHCIALQLVVWVDPLDGTNEFIEGAKDGQLSKNAKYQQNSIWLHTWKWKP